MFTNQMEEFHIKEINYNAYENFNRNRNDNH